jgi:hypothetical protein
MMMWRLKTRCTTIDVVAALRQLLVIKAVGAASERGKSLEELEALGNRGGRL